MVPLVGFAGSDVLLRVGIARITVDPLPKLRDRLSRLLHREAQPMRRVSMPLLRPRRAGLTPSDFFGAASGMKGPGSNFRLLPNVRWNQTASSCAIRNW